MSEPDDKLDMASLGDALGEDKDGKASNSGSAGAKGSAAKSDTDGYTIGEGDNAEERIADTKSKSTTLADGKDDGASKATKGQSAAKPASTPAADKDDPDDELDKLDPTSRQIKQMFPEVDTDTIQAVVTAEGGDFEKAINTLLSMSDPTYVPPPPSKESAQTNSDAELARALAAEEEDRARDRQQRREGGGGGFFAPSSRGGGLGALFSGMSSPGEQRPAQSPPYDPNALSYQAYQPRVRRTNSGQPASGQQQQQQPYQQQYQPGPQQAVQQPGEGAPWPGPREAKAWQEDINRMAETGFAKAASTFAALRQRGEQTFQEMKDSRAQNQGGMAGGPSGAGVGGPGSFFGGWNQRKNSNSAMSPTMQSGKGFDRDASPVGDNELAKILQRGSNSQGYDGTGGPQRKGSNPSMDRYKNAASGARRPSGSSTNKALPQAGKDEDDEDLGWDDAGRTGGSQPSDKPFEPIKIHDGTSSEKSSTQPPPTRNAVSMMEKSTGRGISPSPRGKSTDSHSGTAAAGAAGVGAGAATGAAAGKGKANDSADDADDGNSDDLEYVANPFEDDD